MSSDRRPWYPWYPRDFNQDEKVKCLSDDAELLYRRALDVMWQATALQLPSNCLKLALALARGWTTERFEKAWSEVQTPGYELFKTTENGDFIYSERLSREADKIKRLSEIRSIQGSKGKAKQLPSNCQAKAKQKPNHTDTDTDNNPLPPLEEKKPRRKFTPPALNEVKAYFKQNGYSAFSAEKAWNYYEAGNPPWHDSKGNPVRSWKQKMQANWFKLENKIQNLNTGYNPETCSLVFDDNK